MKPQKGIECFVNMKTGEVGFYTYPIYGDDISAKNRAAINSNAKALVFLYETMEFARQRVEEEAGLSETKKEEYLQIFNRRKAIIEAFVRNQGSVNSINKIKPISLRKYQKIRSDDVY